jgi:dipeptide/tripeptide permease
VTASRKILIFGGLALAALGMLYGLHYAVFVEHQTLNNMGGFLFNAFSSAATGNMNASASAVQGYAAVRYDYVRQVDLHAHWIGLAMVMIVLGVVFESVAFGERTRIWLAIALMTGSVIFPLGVILQTIMRGSAVGSALAIAGSVLVIAPMAAIAFGLAREPS